MNKQQQTFVTEMLCHGDKLKAYRTAFPKVKSENAVRSSVNRLLQNAAVKAAIDEPTKRLRAEAEAELKDRMKEELLSFHEAQVILTNIIRGTHITQKWVKEKEGWKMLDVTPTQSNIISALNQFFRLNQHYPQKKTATEQKQEQKAADIAKAEADYKILRAKIPPWPTNNPHRHPFGDIYPPGYPGPFYDPQDPNTKEQFLAITEPYRLSKLSKEKEQQTTTKNNNSHPHVPSWRGTKQSNPNTDLPNATLEKQQTTTENNNLQPLLPSLRGTKQSNPNTDLPNATLEKQQTTTENNNLQPLLPSLRGTKQSNPNTDLPNATLEQQQTTTNNNNPQPEPTLQQQIDTKYKHLGVKTRQILFRDALRKEGWQTIEDAFNEVYPLYLANQHSKGREMLKRFEKAKENRNLPPHQLQQIETETGWKCHPQYAGFMRKTRALIW